MCLSLFVLPAGLKGDENARLEQKIEALVQRYSRRLGLEQRVVVTIVAANARLASVQSVRRDGETYRIEFESAFLRTLDERDLKAAVAHEMGHVWIFTHFPFLHTEALANRQALKLVSRSDLERVYEKVWSREGRKRNLAKVLDPAGEIDTSRESK